MKRNLLESLSRQRRAPENRPSFPQDVRLYLRVRTAFFEQCGDDVRAERLAG
jgi:hypothetical protein